MSNESLLPTPNISVPPIDITSTTGIITLVIGLVLLVVAVYIVYKVLKNLIANAVIGGVGLIVLHFVIPHFFDVNIEMSLLNIVISLVAGLPGLVIVLILTLFGIS
ncbi:pro-sigmaK processing inhibitor BofA family protein [archaeon]|nr:pro-sigmaK processing inhibitor BofA family protein [archaeon]